MNLTPDNYYSVEANAEYWSASFVKQMRKCQAFALAEMSGNYVRERSSALMVGSFVDAYFESPLAFNDFCDRNMDYICKRNGEFRAEFVKADEMCKFAQSDPVFMEYMRGDHQKIVTGEIEGIKFKAKLDMYLEGERIVDLKTTQDMNSKYVKGRGKVNFAEAWDWPLQMAIYQELVRQETGKLLPCYLAVITKESIPKLEVVQLDQEILDSELAILKAEITLFDAIKNGLIEPKRCEDCEFCRRTRKLNKPILLSDFDMEE